MLLMMGHVIVWITSFVVHSHIWEGELHRHLDHDDIVHERSIRIGTRSTSPDRGIDTWKPFYQSLDCFEFLGEVGFPRFMSAVLAPSVESCCVLQLEYPRAA
ncbi:hypothetical protein F2Q70_00015193 [Brassica cretica]|uniref:Secreted protein n=1 Tax=Brassica cretica TaxID=69181 RepID=A0A8S9I3R8_BRACR|nr:hypothetical protein F2Q70_00015193 [Brassica cretica]